MKKRNYCLKRAFNYLYEALNKDPSTQMENLKKQYPTKKSGQSIQSTTKSNSRDRR